MQAHLPDFFNRGEAYEGHWREYTLQELAQMFEWLDIKPMEAHNVQSMRLGFKLSSPRSWYVGLFRLISHYIPGAGDTNSIIGRKS